MLTSHDLGVHINKTQGPRYQGRLCSLSSLCQKDQLFFPSATELKKSNIVWNWQWAYEVSEVSTASMSNLPREALESSILSFPSTVEKGCSVDLGGKQSLLTIHFWERPACEPAYHAQ